MLQIKRIVVDDHSGMVANTEEQDIISAMITTFAESDEVMSASLEANKIAISRTENTIITIASSLEYKIITIEGPIRDTIYAVVYDNEIPVSYDENYEIVSNEFIMNNL